MNPKKPSTAAAKSNMIPNSQSSLKANDDSTFEPGVKVRSGAKFAEERKQKEKEEQMKRMKRFKCKFLFE
jgi:hypothetical protein